MTTGLTNNPTGLAAMEIVRLAAPGNVRISCERGLVWVTAEGRRGDYWLVAGESVELDRARRVVIEAAQASAIRICRRAAQSRIARWLASCRAAMAALRLA